MPTGADAPARRRASPSRAAASPRAPFGHLSRASSCFREPWQWQWSWWPSWSSSGHRTSASWRSSISMAATGAKHISDLSWKGRPS
nr:unnamed protein product [Digitaria exilis]